jgi:hypothetical protein
MDEVVDFFDDDDNDDDDYDEYVTRLCDNKH